MKEPAIKKLLLLVLLFVSGFAEADTISNWRVYLNGVKIRDLNAYTKNRITLKGNDYKKGDVLEIDYSDDTKCHNCNYTLEVRGNAKETLFFKNFKNESERIRIDLKALLDDYNFRRRKSYYIVYFMEKDPKGKTLYDIRLLNIEME